MSKNKRKANTSMEQTPQTPEETQAATETTVDQTNDQAPVVEEKQATEVQQQETQAPAEIKLGTVVENTTAPLGKAADEETVKQITSQPSKAVAPTLSKFDQKIKAIFDKGDSTQQTIISNMYSYVETMTPGKLISIEQGKVAQKTLWNTIFRVVNTEENFNENYKILVMFFRNYADGALGDLYPFRFIEEMKNLGNTEQRAFMQMLNLLIVSAGFSNNKDVKKHVSVERSVAVHFNQDAQQRLINYYAN